MNEAHKHLPTALHTDIRFIIGAVLALSVLVAFVLILHSA